MTTRHFVLGILAALALAAPLTAELTATVAAVSGKVQVQKGTDWVAVKVGQTLPLGATISTGFRSEAQLKIGPSTVTIKPLSRLTIQSLVQTGDKAATDLYLKVGKVSAVVNSGETVKTQTFTVKSPVATASVRGTAFTFDGVRLEVTRGLVDFIDAKGITLPVPVGESAKSGLPGTNQNSQSDADLVAQDSSTQADASTDYGDDGWTDQDSLDFLASLSDADLAALIAEILAAWPNTTIFVRGIN